MEIIGLCEIQLSFFPEIVDDHLVTVRIDIAILMRHCQVNIQ